MVAPPVLPEQPLIPDYPKAIMGFLRAQPAIVALHPEMYIGGEIEKMPQKSWGIGVIKNGSPFGAHPFLPAMSARLDIRWYGPSKHQAMLLWRTGHPYLQPKTGAASSWLAYDVVIFGVELVAGPTDLVDPDGSPFVWTQYLVEFAEQVYATD